MEQIYKDRINQIIGAIRNDTGDHFRMASYVQYLSRVAYGDARAGKYVPCNTAFCIGGWANFFRLQEQTPKILSSNTFLTTVNNGYSAAEWLGLEYSGVASTLFNMSDVSIGLDDFDETPLEARRAAGIRVLEILRDTGKVDWRTALTENGIDPDQDLNKEEEDDYGY